ncbi:TetR/AcrR family transcriptional regulator [Streptomyces sp. NBC_01216]|uniref:TetR/AcrR family transcriptional regulator n=1 Tax=unclassified Streptomyces TaxID=2593676 RepID=UPI002E0E0F88|nr:TetR/AcrR family transcriptional regulator [Streptomyces sp. NBC_01216]
MTVSSASGPDAGPRPGPTGASPADAGLRRRLIATGVALVHAEGAQALTLREIARRAGVSHGAPRRHFPTHLDLLSAIAREGFAELAARVAETAPREQEDAADARARLEALARTYLDFALTRRGMYELMFRHDLLESGRLGLRETSLPLFAALTDLVDRVRGEGPSGPASVDAGGGVPAGAALGAEPRADTGAGDPGSASDPAVVAGALWAGLHGIAQLWSWGSLRLATRTEEVGPLLRAILDAHLGESRSAR